MIREYSLGCVDMVTPDRVIKRGSIVLDGERIALIGHSKNFDYKVDGCHLFPALFNAHDHLFGTYYPKVGKGPYINWLPWDNELKSSAIYVERNHITARDLYLLGAYKNLISGALTVSDHIPHSVNEPFIDELPIRVIRDYSLAHEVSSFDLKWGDGVEVEYSKAVERDIPFITHIEEGFDEESMRGVEILHEMNALGPNAVLVHGIAMSDSDIKLIARYGASFVWCPDSNMFMFNRTADVKKILEEGVNVSIGTDSPASGSLNILEEMRFAKKTYREIYGEELDDRTIIEMVTVNPSKALRLHRELGTIEEGKIADLIFITKKNEDSYAALINCELSEIDLVIHKGKPIYGSSRHEPLFKKLGVEVQRVSVMGEDKLLMGDPLGMLERIRKAVGFRKVFPFFPVEKRI